ncbi:MAG: OmpA/MotB domain protein [Bryobacterales bacterium]|nr:OmpA/MotB domain protein [Bryobacterales bacterium]
MTKMKIISVFLTACGLLCAQPTQAPNPVQQAVADGPSVPIYRVTVVARTTKAINYNHRSGSTMIGFRGTALMPAARGEAKVESRQGVIKIDSRMQKLQPATQYGPEYLTYVMWAVTPEGRATNVGEVLLNGENSKLDATTELQSFGLIVTAEPYFAVTQPSDVVVMENFVQQGTTGTIEEIDAKYELLQRGQYTLNVNPAEIKPIRLDSKVPLELHEARNAVRIARWTGADRYAADTYLKATQGLENAEGYLKGKSGKKPIGTVARESVQMAEDARIITIKKIAEERLAAERAEAAGREARAVTASADAKSETDRVTREAEQQRAKAQSEADRAKLSADALIASARADTDRAGKEKAEAEAARLAAVAGQQAAQAETEKANLATQAADQLRLKAEAEKTALRARLFQQFNLVLETRDTARGLIVNLSDVLFDTGKYSLRPAAREKLARVAGIILGHSTLNLDVEGYTDSVGTDEYNQHLSEQRGESVRDYLTTAGIARASVSSKGFGKLQPVASNDTAAGRQLNRRVELVISGEIIGTVIGTPIALKR